MDSSSHFIWILEVFICCIDEIGKSNKKNISSRYQVSNRNPIPTAEVEKTTRDLEKFCAECVDVILPSATIPRLVMWSNWVLQFMYLFRWMWLGDKSTVVLGVRLKTVAVAAPSPVISTAGPSSSQSTSGTSGSNASSPLPPHSSEAFGGAQHGSGAGSASCWTVLTSCTICRHVEIRS